MRASFEKEILAAASEEFAQHGFENMSLRHLAKKMGCAVGTLYLYFKNKEELLHAVVELSFQQLLERVEALPCEGDPVAAIRAGFRTYVEFGLEFPHHYRCAFALPQPAKPSRYQPHRAFEWIRHQVRAGIQQGVLRAGDVDSMTQIVWVAVHGLTSLLIARPNFPWAPHERLIDELSDTMLRGLVSASPRKTPSARRRR